MKKYILIFLVFPLFAFTQSPSNNQIKNATKISDYVADKHSLSDEDKEFFYNATLNQIVSNAAKIKEQGLTDPEDKKVIYRAGYNNLRAKFSKKFGSQMAVSLLKSSNEARRQ